MAGHLGQRDPATRDRFFDAVQDLERRERAHIPVAEFGRRVERIVGYRFDRQTARAWIEGAVPRQKPHATMRAIARVLGVRPGWLYFGEGPRRAGKGKRKER